MSEREDDRIARFDADLRAALDLEPSPGFASRVRAAVDDAREQRSFGGWLIAVAAVSGALVILWLHNRSAEPRFDDGARLAAVVAPASSAGLAPVPLAAARVASSSASRASRPSRREPDVLIAPGEAAALERLLAALRQGHLVLPPVIAVPPASLPILDAGAAPLTPDDAWFGLSASAAPGGAVMATTVPDDDPMR